MGFGRRNGKRDSRDNGYRKKGKLKTIIRLVGVLVVVISFIIVPKDLNHNNTQNGLISVGLLVIGVVMIFQRRLLVGLKNLKVWQCQCCKCQNCGRNHNHWTHD